jgi:MFS family permease
MVTTRQAAFYAAAVNIGAGLMFGYAVGFVPVCLQYNAYMTNCTRYVGDSACAAVGGCTWLNQSTTCEFTDRVGVPACSFYSNATRDQCADQHGCFWDGGSGVCEHVAGWSVVEQGLIATMMIIGGTIGSLVASPALAFLGRSRAKMASGLTTAVAGAVQAVAWQRDLYGLLLVSRVMMGVAIGVATVASPLYCGEVAPTRWRNVIGVFLQNFICLGTCVPAIMALIFSPKDDVSVDGHLLVRFQVFNAMACVSGVSYTLIAAVVPPPTPELLAAIRVAEGQPAPLLAAEINTDESLGTPPTVHHMSEPLATQPTLLNHDAREDRCDGATDYNDSNGAMEADKLPECDFETVKLFVVGFFMSSAVQMTGINAIANYAPSIAQRSGVDPLLGNLLIMVWKVVFTAAALPFAKRFNPGKTFVVATFIASGAILFAGIPSYPGVIASATAQHACVCAGVLLFVAAFEIGIGPLFYPLSQALFPSNLRRLGCSFCLMVQFLLNCLINFGYPVAVQELSGGESGNQSQGQALVFIIFGACGLLIAAFLLRHLPR